MEAREMIDLCKRHTLYTWAATDAVDPLAIERAEGIYLYEPGGRRIMDWNASLMAVLIGHGHPKVLEAMRKQMESLVFVYPQVATPVRARVSKLLSEVVPGDINTFFFTTGGAEANENAIKMARQFTGRAKVLSRYRSYHGASNLTMQLTGDPRRWANEPGTPGIIRVMDPEPYDYSFGDTDAAKAQNNLAYLEEIIRYEGPHTIGAMIVESVVGTNGIIAPPTGYLKGLKDLLSRHGILLICDEVMSGFGRTGRMFAFEHGGIVPDIVTMAKGLTSAYFPLGAVGVSDRIAEHFKKNTFWGGLTYNSHPLGLATAEAVIKVIQEEGLVERAAKMEALQRQHMQKLKDKHPSVRGFRSIGLFGIVELQKKRTGERMAPYNGVHPAMKKLESFFRKEGLLTFVRWNAFMCNPPLVITEEQLAAGYEIIDRGLEITDEAVEA